MSVVYLDLVFLTNTAMNSLLLWLAGRMCGLRPRARIVMAGALGGGYACLCVLGSGGGLGQAFLVAALMVVVAFGLRPPWELATLLSAFWLVALVSGGIATALAAGHGGGELIPRWWMAVAAAAATTGGVLARWRWRPRQPARLVEVSIRVAERVSTVRALVDSGLSLREPLLGLPVVVVDHAGVGTLLPGMAPELLDPGRLPELVAACGHSLGGRFAVIPYRSLGQPQGLLLGFRPDEVRVDGTVCRAMVAVYPGRIGAGDYRALVPPELCPARGEGRRCA